MKFCGVDVIEVERIKQAILRTEGFKEKVYTAREIEVGEAKCDKIKYQYYAGRFAAKEAIYKALSDKYGNVLSLNEIEVLNDSNKLDRPYVNIYNGKVAKLHKNNLINIDISISHIENIAIASATAEIVQTL